MYDESKNKVLFIDECSEGEQNDFCLLQWISPTVNSVGNPRHDYTTDDITFFYRHRNKVRETTCKPNCFNEDKVGLRKILLQ